ncbi:MAG: carbohydrate kinase family protein [Elusimicrobia bacterium]|nr:carbohydrate kinase family protein [Elusimicrobiota bacterium]
MEVIVAGHICLDITPKFSKNILGKNRSNIFVPGVLMNVNEAAVSTGGTVSNTGLVLAKLGINVSLMGKVGDDLFGEGIINILGKYGNISNMSKVKGKNTSYTIVLAVPGNDRMFLHYPGTNDTFGYKDIDYKTVKRAKLFHFGYPTQMKRLYSNNGLELIKIFKKVKSLGVITSLDMALPDSDSESGKVNWSNILRKLMPFVDIFLPSFEEICFMLNPGRYRALKKIAGKNSIDGYFTADDLSEIASTLLKYGGKIIVLKCSRRGIYARTAQEKLLKKTGEVKTANMSNWSGRELWLPSYYAGKIASATGSGDSAIAGFLAAFLKGMSIEESLKCANGAGLQNLRAFDAVSGITDWNEVVKIIKNKKVKMNCFKLTAPGWKWAGEAKNWIGPNDKN